MGDGVRVGAQAEGIIYKPSGPTLSDNDSGFEYSNGQIAKIPGVEHLDLRDRRIAYAVFAALANLHSAESRFLYDYPYALAVRTNKEAGTYHCLAFGYEYPVQLSELQRLREGGGVQHHLLNSGANEPAHVLDTAATMRKYVKDVGVDLSEEIFFNVDKEEGEAADMKQFKGAVYVVVRMEKSLRKMRISSDDVCDLGATVSASGAGADSDLDSDSDLDLDDSDADVPGNGTGARKWGGGGRGDAPRVAGSEGPATPPRPGAKDESTASSTGWLPAFLWPFGRRKETRKRARDVVHEVEGKQVTRRISEAPLKQRRVSHQTQDPDPHSESSAQCVDSATPDELNRGELN